MEYLDKLSIDIVRDVVSVFLCERIVQVDQGLGSCSTASHSASPDPTSAREQGKIGRVQLRVKHFSAFFPDCPLLCPKYGGFPLPCGQK